MANLMYYRKIPLKVRPCGVIPALKCCCSLRAYPDLSCDLDLLLHSKVLHVGDLVLVCISM